MCEVRVKEAGVPVEGSVSHAVAMSADFVATFSQSAHRPRVHLRHVDKFKFIVVGFACLVGTGSFPAGDVRPDRS
eukprot:11512176-Alexandrium_andersonii.AAC.1